MKGGVLRKTFGSEILSYVITQHSYYSRFMYCLHLLVLINDRSYRPILFWKFASSTLQFCKIHGEKASYCYSRILSLHCTAPTQGSQEQICMWPCLVFRFDHSLVRLVAVAALKEDPMSCLTILLLLRAQKFLHVTFFWDT